MLKVRSRIIIVHPGGSEMELIIANRILQDPLFREKLAKIERLEEDRIFCGHGLEHLLSVGRMAMLMCIEKGVEVSPDVLYSAALLHDIGRVEEYTLGISHDISGPETAGKILEQVGCDPEDSQQILHLIAGHRHKDPDPMSLEAIFYAADKKSRMCSFCKAQEECCWPDEKRNHSIEV